jgi:hypothetical protein
MGVFITTTILADASLGRLAAARILAAWFVRD